MVPAFDCCIASKYIGNSSYDDFWNLADWLGVGESGLYNFKPSVRPVPLEVHIQDITDEDALNSIAPVSQS
ncbi:DExH-box ATP-dependent RNA helicase DExH14 [Bienertia sinuspersici]